MFTSTLASSLPKFPFSLLGFDQHIVRIAVAFFPPLPQSPEPRPIILFTLVHDFDNLEVRPASGFFYHDLEVAEEFPPEKRERLQASEIGKDSLEILVERVEGFVDSEFLRWLIHAAASATWPAALTR
jgi:hypothetical protein